MRSSGSGDCTRSPRYTITLCSRMACSPRCCRAGSPCDRASHEYCPLSAVAAANPRHDFDAGGAGQCCRHNRRLEHWSRPGWLHASEPHGLGWADPAITPDYDPCRVAGPSLAMRKYKGESGFGLEDAEKFVGAQPCGFQVDDVEATKKRIEAAGGKFFFTLGKSKEEANFEVKFKDPDGVIFDISEKGWLK